MRQQIGPAAALKEMAERAERMAWALNCIALFAAPQVVAKLHAAGKRLPSGDEAAAHLDVLVASTNGDTFEMGGIRRSADDLIPIVRALQRLLQGWVPASGVTLQQRECARMLLETLGIPEPPEGWDHFEGLAPTEPEPVDPDPRPAPTADEVAARPDIVRMTRALGWCMYVASPKMIAKIPARELHRPALSHVDCLLAAYRPLRSDHAQGRARLLSLVDTVQRLRELCELWDGRDGPSREIQRAAQVVLGHGNPDQTPEKCEAFDDDVDPACLLLPRPD